MAIRPIVFYPDPVLLTPAKEVTVFDEALKTLITDMFETMYDAKGVGLAAPQIGISKRLCVIDIGGEDSKKIVLINPEIVDYRDPISMTEGCLSVPGTSDTLKRYNYAAVKALDENGKSFTMDGEGLLAEAFQHEIDHLNGKLYISYLSSLKQSRAKKRLEKYKKQHGY